MHTNTKTFLILGVTSFLFFLFSVYVVESSLKNKESTAIELMSPKESIYNYNSSEISPFKYRILFSSIVKISYDTLKGDNEDDDLFYYTYVTVSGITFIFATLSFCYLLLSIGFSSQYSFLGSLIFLVSPSVIFAFTMPVHSREDFLAYSILCLGLIGIIKNRTGLVFFFCILGILCRETLLILPFLYLIFQPKAKLIYRLGIAALSFGLFLSIRIYTGYESYNVLNLGLHYNLNNLAESVGFLFLSFSFMWIFLVINIYKTYVKEKLSSNKEIQFFQKSALWVFLLVFLSTLVGGRFNEMRLMNLMFPWMIVIFLYYFQKYNKAILSHVQSHSFKIFTVGILILLVTVLVIALNSISTYFPPGKYAVPYDSWVILTFLYLFIFSLTVFLVTRYIIAQKSYSKGYVSKVSREQ